MQENHRNGQDDSDIAEASKPFTVTRAALNRHINSSVDHNWFKVWASGSTGRSSLINSSVDHNWFKVWASGSTGWSSLLVLRVQKVVRNFLKSSGELENVCCKLKWI